MVADTTGEHGAGMTGHSDAAAQHVEGGADGAPARTRPEYDHEGLESLVGFLSVTDSQRLRKAGGAAPDKERLAQRANAEEWRLRSEEVETLERIGSGQCAEVYKARWRGMYAVAKVLKGASDYREGWTLDTARDDLVHEISVLSHLRHPNLVLFLGAVLQQDNVILLNEYMDGSNLEEFVTQLKKRRAGSRAHVPRKQCARWGIDLGQAITFLHACNPPVIHRDLKPANLLLSSDGRLKVGDFGLSSTHRRGVVGDSFVMTGRTGTIRYMAPEAMLVDEQGYSNYNENVDCYSAAMVLWYMCMADRPFGDLDADLIMAGAANGLRPELSSIERRHGKNMSDAIKSCWEADPAKRSSAEQLLDSMREQLKYIEDKKARRRLPATIYRWASAAANKVSAAIGSQKGKGGKIDDPVHDRGGRGTAEDRAHKEIAAAVPRRGSPSERRDGSEGSLDSTASLDSTGGSLDSTANSMRSAGSNDDWFRRSRKSVLG